MKRRETIHNSLSLLQFGWWNDDGGWATDIQIYSLHSWVCRQSEEEMPDICVLRAKPRDNRASRMASQTNKCSTKVLECREDVTERTSRFYYKTQEKSDINKRQLPTQVMDVTQTKHHGEVSHHAMCVTWSVHSLAKNIDKKWLGKHIIMLSKRLHWNFSSPVRSSWQIRTQHTNTKILLIIEMHQTTDGELHRNAKIAPANVGKPSWASEIQVTYLW